jgi:plastocyanin
MAGWGARQQAAAQELRMRTLRFLSIASLALSPLALACSDDDNGTEPTLALVGTWNATSFQGLGQDFIAMGMDLTITFTNTGTYTIAFQNDLIGACDPGPACTQNGAYTATSNQVTLDPGTPDTVTFTWAVQGTTLTLSGSIDGTPVTIVLARD